MKISIIKCDENRLIRCSNEDCEENIDLFSINLPYVGLYGRKFIKAGTLIACVVIGYKSEQKIFYYCFDCIDKINLEIKKSLNTSLWAFH